MRTEDGQIIYKCLNGDSAAFGFLVDKYRESIYAFAYDRLGNFQDAEDVAQEVFIKAYQKLRTLRRWDSFLGWLYSITSNQCKMLIRSRSSRPDREFIEDHTPEILEMPSRDSYQQEDAQEIIREALESLPELYRQSLTLYYLGGMNSVEIARFVGASPVTIRKRLSNARAMLKKEVFSTMSEVFESQRLQAGFTFRVLELARHLRIHPVQRLPGLPWGLSLTAGIIIAVLCFSSYMTLPNPMNIPTDWAIPGEAKVLETGEIAVDILRSYPKPRISSTQGGSENRGNKMQNTQDTFLLAPHVQGDSWTAKPDMLTERYACSASVVGGKIYVIGGGKTWGDPNPMSTVEVYDPATETWTRMADMPTPRWALSTAVVDGKIYAIGGARGHSQLSAVEVYDPEVDTWEENTSMSEGRSWLSTSVVDGRIYAIGGHDISSVEEYNPTTDKWTRKADMPTVRWAHASSVVNGRIYVFSGTSNPPDNMSSTLEYDPAADSWIRKADIPTPRGGLSAVAVNEVIYVIGGSFRSDDPGLPNVEVYDPVTDTWEKKADMPTPRHSLPICEVGGQIYAIGGTTENVYSPGVLSTVEIYTPEGFSAAVSPQDGRVMRTWGATKSD